VAHEVPPLVLDGIGLFFHDESPHKVRNGHRRVQLEVQGDVVFGSIEQVNEAPSGLVDELEQVVARPEREHSVQRGDIASSCREVEEIAVAVRGQVALRGTRELLLQEAHVRVQPACFVPTNDTSERCQRCIARSPRRKSDATHQLLAFVRLLSLPNQKNMTYMITAAKRNTSYLKTVLRVNNFRARCVDRRATHVRDERRRFSRSTPSLRIRQE
jgi:hypothetical protein